MSSAHGGQRFRVRVGPQDGGVAQAHPGLTKDTEPFLCRNALKNKVSKANHRWRVVAGAKLSAVRASSRRQATRQRDRRRPRAALANS